MIRLLLKLSLIIIFAFGATALAARTLGTTQPPSPALASFAQGCADKPRPCWYGIVLGVTTMEEAGTLINNPDFVVGTTTSSYMRFYLADTNPICKYVELTSMSRKSTVDRIYLQECRNIYLRDVLAFACCPDGYVLTGNGGLWMRTFDGKIALESPEGTYTPIWQPSMNVTRIWIFSTHLPVDLKWRGFIPRRRYCQLELNTPEC